MKVKTSILSRALAMLLALVLSFANVPGLVLTAFAAGAHISAGAVMAENYNFTDAEKDLLKSGYLVGGEDINIPPIADNWVTVDADEKEITVKEENGWVAESADIIVDGEVKQNVKFTDRVAKYTYDGAAFSVNVNYALKVNVAEEQQKALIENMAALKQGVANLDAVKAQSSNISVLEQAMPELIKFADNGVALGSSGMTVGFAESGITAVKELNAQMTANGGKINLGKMVNVYGASYKTAYLVENNEDMRAEVIALVEKLAVINTALTTLYNNISWAISGGHVSEDTANQIETLTDVCAKLEEGLRAVKAESWVEINNDVITSGDATLDALVAAIGDLTNDITVKNQLIAARYTAQARMNTKNVDVKVVLKAVDVDVDSEYFNTVVEYSSKSDVIVVEEAISEEALTKKVADSGIEAVAIAEWADKYVAEHFERTVKVTGDSYTVTFAPKTYAITGYTEMTVPYGYKFMLEPHENPEQAYDYIVNGKAYAQGEDVTILGATEITRTFGKSYTTKNLYAIIAENYGDELAKAILTSGALKGDETISYRKPDPTEAEDLVKLEGGQVSAQATYASAYNNFDWVPYTYGVNGDEKNFNGASSAEHLEDSVKVVYRLDLENYSKEDVQAILNLAATLKADANDQIGVMNNLADMLDELKQLDEGKFGALVGVIGVTDFTPEDGTKEDEANKYMQGYFSDVVNKIINNHLDPDAFLKIYNMVVKYSNEGLEYYYENAAAIINEVTKLAGYLGNMTDEEEALKILVAKAGFPEYAEKITGVEVKLNNILAALKAPNAAIDVESENLYKLVKALTDGGETSCTATGSPYILSEALKATDASQTYVQVIININGERISVDGAEVVRGTVLSEEYVANLKNAVETKVNETLGANKAHYNLEGKNLDELVGETLSSKLTIEHTYTEKAYTFIIEGEAETQTVTVNSLKVKLPGHPKAAENWEYRYTIDGVEGITKPEYVFTVEQLNNLFAGGSYTVSRVEVDVAKEKLEGVFSEWLVKDVNGNVTGLYAKVDANKDGVMAFATTIINSGYSYIGLNGEPLLYMNADNATEVRLQTLINAILKDNQFSNETLVELGNNGKGEFVHASMQLGTGEGIVFEDLDFTLYLNSVPSQMATVAKGLEKVESYMTFKSNNGVMAVDVTLPEKVYEVYLAALIATGNVDKDDMDTVNSEIASQFLWDYVELIMATDANTTTYTNTLAKLGIDKDLTGAEEYYQLAKKALTNPGVVVNPEDDDDLADLTVTANGQKAINGIINLLGVDVSAYDTYIGMIYEYKGEGRPITASATANLVNTNSNFEAALVDVKQPAESKIDYLDKFDFTKDLPSRVKTLAGEAAVILLDTVDGDLVFDQPTILDLNGQTVNGNIVANAKVLIFDSKLDTFDCGVVTGTVSGNATIVGGKYASDVTALIPEGFEVENDVVRNVLYTIEENNGDVLFKADADILDKDIVSYTEAAGMIAADMAVDLVLNYFTSASLYADGFKLYNISLDDIIGLYDSTNRKQQLIDKALEWVSLDGLNGFINDILDQLLDFAAIEEAIDNDAAILSFQATVAPWSVTVAHKTEGDYITFGVAPNTKLEETFNVGLVLDGSDAKQDYAEKLFGNLADITEKADANVKILRPSYNNNHFYVSGEGDVEFIFNVTKAHLEKVNAEYTNEEYLNVLAVVFANGVKDEAKADALVKAIGKDSATMKAAIDALTVKDVFDALKNMSVANTFEKMAASLGITADLGDAATLEEIYHLIANAAGEGLEYLDITGPSRTIGSFWNESTGYYEYTTTRSANKTVSKGGYSLTVGAEITKATLKVALFDSHDHVIDPDKTTVVTVPATCEKDGSVTTTYYCACGVPMDEDVVVLPASGHDWKEVRRENATCIAEGKIYYECQNDPTHTKKETIPVDENAHDWDNDPEHIRYEWTQDNNGKWTCTATRYCKHTNNHSETVEGTITSEVVEKATCCEPGTTRYTATFNETWAKPTSQELNDIPVDPDAHKWGNWVTVKEPTYTEEGLARRFCEYDSAHFEERIIPKKRRPSSGGIIIDLTGKDDEGNPETGAPVFD